MSTFILRMIICNLNFREKPWPLCPPPHLWLRLLEPSTLQFWLYQKRRCEPFGHAATHALCNFGAITCLREAQNCAMVRQTWCRGYFKLKICGTLHWTAECTNRPVLFVAPPWTLFFMEGPIEKVPIRIHLRNSLRYLAPLCRRLALAY